MAAIRPYRHGNLPAALVAAARQILDEGGLHAVGLRETARRVDVSATAAYRHFANKEDLLASVAAEGFRELGAAMEDAATEDSTAGPSALSRGGLAYVSLPRRIAVFFGLMFGPILVERGKYPALEAAVNAVSDFLVRHVDDLDRRPRKERRGHGGLGSVHGLSHLMIDGFVPATQARTMAQEILGEDPAAEGPWPEPVGLRPARRAGIRRGQNPSGRGAEPKSMPSCDKGAPCHSELPQGLVRSQGQDSVQLGQCLHIIKMFISRQFIYVSTRFCFYEENAEKIISSEKSKVLDAGASSRAFP